MTEREYTRQSGELAKRFDKAGLFWLSFADSGRRQFNKMGCDGILCNPVDHTFAFVEVKIGNKILTPNELKFAKLLMNAGFYLYVIKIDPVYSFADIVGKDLVCRDYWTDKIERALNG